MVSGRNRFFSELTLPVQIFATITSQGTDSIKCSQNFLLAEMLTKH